MDPSQVGFFTVFSASGRHASKINWAERCDAGGCRGVRFDGWIESKARIEHAVCHNTVSKLL